MNLTENISALKNNLNEDYEHAQKVSKHFDTKTDVPLLSDVFENFRHICLKN